MCARACHCLLMRSASAADTPLSLTPGPPLPAAPRADAPAAVSAAALPDATGGRPLDAGAAVDAAALAALAAAAAAAVALPAAVAPAPLPLPPRGAAGAADADDGGGGPAGGTGRAGGAPAFARRRSIFASVAARFAGSPSASYLRAYGIFICRMGARIREMHMSNGGGRYRKCICRTHGRPLREMPMSNVAAATGQACAYRARRTQEMQMPTGRPQREMHIANRARDVRGLHCLEEARRALVLVWVEPQRELVVRLLHLRRGKGEGMGVCRVRWWAQCP